MTGRMPASCGWPSALPAVPDLERQARDFAERVQRLLNTTICKGVRIAAVVTRDPAEVHIGDGLTKSGLKSAPFAVQHEGKKPSCWLDVRYSLCLGAVGEHLMVRNSYFGVYAPGKEPSKLLCHFDYEREKEGGHAYSHVQVEGECPALAAWGRRKLALGRLHFPAGGRRYRLILEDVIQFLIAEELAEGREGWKDVLDDERETYNAIQLQAAVQHDPDTAAAALSEIGYRVTEPD
jgi:hypothetical protein